jgi:hypothetical protein
MRILKVLAAGCLLSVIASAEVIVFGPIYPTVGGSGFNSTDWSDTILLPKFNPALGTLTSAEFSITGSIKSNVQAENKTASPATITIHVTGQLTLTRPDLTEIISIFPLYEEPRSVGAYDGAVDFDGTSGFTVSNLTATTTDSYTESDLDALLLFIGTGSIELPVSAFGASSADGPSQLEAQITSVGSASAFVTYTYDPAPVPEPGTVSLAGSCLALLVFYRRNRRK